MHKKPDLNQLLLFSEIIEFATTADVPFENDDGSWGTMVTRPVGKGWRISDFTHDRWTEWSRRVPVCVGCGGLV